MNESFRSGEAAVLNAVNGITDKMVGYERRYEDGKYVCDIKLFDLADVANTEKKFPAEWINESGDGITEEYLDYVMPLIQGEPATPRENSLSVYDDLKKILLRN